MRKTPLEMTRKNAVKLMRGDNLELLKGMPDNCIDAIVTDGPYGLSFMHKKWDYDVPSVDFWKEIFRVLKPGGHVLSFGGTRTYHRMTVNIEDAGFEIRDQIQWIYATGFPKSMNIEKTINKKEGVSFETKPAEGVGFMNAEGEGGYNVTMNQMVQTGDSTENAKIWEGWGTALKPANEPICVARKPLSEKTVVDNVMKWGTGALNIDACRIGKARRFPANIVLDEEAGKALDKQSGPTSQGHWAKGKTKGYGEFGGGESVYEGVGPKDKNEEKGGASRFFYCPKVSKNERNTGTEKNSHPTVKPISLMAYLCRLVTPPQGLVLDPFMGSGSTGMAAIEEGFRFAGMELDTEYFEIAKARVEYSYKKTYENGK